MKKLGSAVLDGVDFHQHVATCTHLQATAGLLAGGAALYMKMLIRSANFCATRSTSWGVNKTQLEKCRQLGQYRVQDSKSQDILQSQHVTWYVIAAQQCKKKKIQDKKKYANNKYPQIYKIHKWKQSKQIKQGQTDPSNMAAHSGATKSVICCESAN